MEKKVNAGRILRKIALVILDAIVVFCASVVALVLRNEFTLPQAELALLCDAMMWVIPCYLVANFLGGIYWILWRYARSKEYIRLCITCACAAAATVALNVVFKMGLYNSVLILTGAYTFGVITVMRYIWRRVQIHKHSPVKGVSPRRTMIVGAGEGAAWAIDNCRAQRYGDPVALVDDDVSKQGLRISGVPVMGTIDEIPAVAEKMNIEDIVIAIPSLTGKRLGEVAGICLTTKCRVRTVSYPREVGADGKPKAPVMRRLNLADMLSRDEIRLDNAKISEYIEGRTVMVTGGGGSIGSEICRQVMRFKPRHLVIFEIYENCAYELLYELRRMFGNDIPVSIMIGSVRDRARLDDVMDKFKPEVVFHAAAHKHVPLMEDSPNEAVKNNVFGTRNTLLSAAAHNVERFIILSTDKAVNPTNVMGATKRITEMIIQTLGKNTNMKCMAVRFGNVLGSHGSVIPLMEGQIRSGGPVTVTHPDITRYFMTIPEAAQLVLQAGSNGQDGAIYVLDMGQPVKIMDLALRLVRFYGYEPNVDMEIKITGLRPGEKLYEELLMDQEADAMTRTAHDLIFVAPPIPMEENVFLRQLGDLETMCEENSADIVEKLKETVSTFHPQNERKVG
ncbi:MAG: polysaccharide biosynthesis protein [Clostridiales bacterium]|nr:polysaccharide biosynthesis protein [Clostridiales bacterium]